MSWPIISSSLQQGFLYALAVYGIAISFRILNFPDLTVDGSFTLGAAVYAVTIINGYAPWYAMLLVAAAGFVAGGFTVALNRKLGISKLLSGILVMMILYSVNLRIMEQANISLLSTAGILSSIEKLGINSPQYLWRLSILPGIILIVLCYLAATRLGLYLRATGDNEFMVRRQGVNTDWPVLIGLGLSNMLVAFCGALVAQSQGFADVNMGVGLIITGLAALIIGETAVDVISSLRTKLFPGRESRLSLLPWRTFRQLTGAFIGCLLYFFIISICLRIGLAPTDLKLATGALVILGVAFRFKKISIETYIRSEW